MELDRQLLEAARNNVASLRIYTWNEPWLTLGRFQRQEEALSRGDIPFSVRPTGGKAVLHGHDVTVSIALPLARLLLDQARKVRQAYRSATEPIILALRSCGVLATLAEEVGVLDSSRSADCFASRSRNDIIDLETGLKVCGCAQVIENSAFLIQCSIPYKNPPVECQSWIKDYRGEPVRPWHVELFPNQFLRIGRAWMEEKIQCTENRTPD